jgi:hypothetical protein
LQNMSQMKHKEVLRVYYILCVTQGGLSSFNISNYDLSVFMVTHCDEKFFLCNWPLQYKIKIPHFVSVQLIGYEDFIAHFSKH